MKPGRILLMAMASLMLSGCVKDLYDEMQAQPGKYPSDTATRALNEMKIAPSPVPVTGPAPAPPDYSGRIAALESELARIKGMMPPPPDLSARMAAAEGDLAKLKARPEPVTLKMPPDLTNRVSSVETDVAGLKAVPMPIMPDTSGLETKPHHADDISALDRRLTALETKIPAPAPKQLAQIKADALFNIGKAEVKEAGLRRLRHAADELKEMGGRVKLVHVEGHTDNKPIHTKEFPSNQELSEARAKSVADFLAKQSGVPADKFAVHGYADTKPVGDNSTKEGRTMNRRVDVNVDMNQ